MSGLPSKTTSDGPGNAARTALRPRFWKACRNFQYILGQSEGSQVSEQNEGDRFIMGLLRASANAIAIGSSTVKATNTRALWLAEVKRPEHALIAIISESGSLDLSGAGHGRRRGTPHMARLPEHASIIAQHKFLPFLSEQSSVNCLSERGSGVGYRAGAIFGRLCALRHKLARRERQH